MPFEQQRRRQQLDGSDWVFPWPGVFELADRVSCEHWSLVGGLMVQLHCHAAGKEPPRPTNDIDTLAHVEVSEHRSLSRLKAGLQQLGYEPKPSLDHQSPLHRYTRNGDWQVDFLIADHVAPSVLRALSESTPVQAPGGTNALHRTIEFEVRHVGGVSTISAPDIVGALMLKIEAHRADSRDRDRHLKDAVTLAGLLTEGNSGPPLHGRGASRIRRLIAQLSDPQLVAETGIDSDSADDAIIALQDLLAVDPSTPETWP